MHAQFFFRVILNYTLKTKTPILFNETWNPNTPPTPTPTGAQNWTINDIFYSLQNTFFTGVTILNKNKQLTFS